MKKFLVVLLLNNALFASIGTNAIDATGNVLMAWQNFCMADNHAVILGASLAPDSTTVENLAILSSTLTNSMSPQIAMHDSGQSVVVWLMDHPDLAVTTICYAFFDPLLGWRTSEVLTGAGENVSCINHVSVNTLGNFMLTWVSIVDGTQCHRFSRASFAGTWSMPQTILPP